MTRADSSTKSPPPTDAHSQRGTPGNGEGSSLRASDLALLAVPPAWASLRIVARNPVGIPHLERLLAVSILLWCLAIAADWALLKRGLNRKTVVYTSFVALVVLLAGGAVLRQRGAVLGLVVMAAVLALMAIVAARLPSSVLPDVLVVVLAVGMISGPIIDAVGSVAGFGSSEMAQAETLSVTLDSRPDVYLVLLDGFPGVDTMDVDFGSGYGSQLASSLESHGLVVPERVSASYPASDYSIPSILEMGYPVTQAPRYEATLQDLYDVISGDNRLTALFADNGYETYMLESGWSGSSCRSWYDHCVASSWFDDPMAQVLRNSIFDEVLVPGSGFQYAVASSTTMQWLGQNLPELSQDSTPSFVFAHVLAPHAPFFLGPDCAIVPSGDRAGYFFRSPGVADETRNEYLREQIDCLESFMLDLHHLVGDDAFLVFASDHGTDRKDQTARDPSEWSPRETDERMLAFVAASLSPDCSLGDELHLPNLMRRVVTCIAEAPLSDNPEHSYLVNRRWDTPIQTG